MLSYVVISLILFKKLSSKNPKQLLSEKKADDDALSLDEIMHQALIETDIDSFIEQIIPKIATTLRVDYIQILELLPNRFALFFKAGQGWAQGLVGAATVSRARDNLFGYTLATKDPVIIVDLPIETRFRGGPLLDNHCITSGVALGIGTKEEKYGLLGVYSKSNREFTPAEIKFLVSISYLLAFVFHNQHQQEELKLFKRALDASSNGVVITDALASDNPVVYVNQSFTKITGYSSEEVTGNNCRFLQGKERLQPEIEEIRNAIAQGKECYTILRNYRQDGTLFWNELYLTPICDRHGSLTHFLGIQSDITNRKIAEQALFESESRFRAIFEQAAVGMAQVSLDGRFLQVNQKACELWGYYPTELIQLRFQDLIHPEEREKSDHLFQALLDHQLPTFTEERRYLHRGGSIVWAQVTVSLVEEKQSTSPYLIAVIVDITERKQLEKAKLADEKRFNSILASLKDGVWSMDLKNQEILYVNQTLRKICGYHLGKLPENLENVYATDRPRVEKISENFLSEQTSKDLEYRIVRPDGEVRWIRDRAQFIYDSTGNPVRIDGIITDITERKQIEEQLRQERDLLNGITQTSVAAIMVLDLEGKIIFANERAEEILAIGQEQLLNSDYNSNVWKIKDFDGNPLPQEVLPFSRVMKTQKPVFEVLHTIEWPDHTLRFLSVNGAPLRKSSGEISGVVICINDITEQQTLEQRLIYNAFYDPLTRLPNRILFTELLHDCVEKRRHEPNYLFAVLFLDVDRFKLVNDTYGHQVGDNLLIYFAHRIKKCLRHHDTLARLSGDEFAILLDQLTQEEDAILVAKDIQARLKSAFYLNGQEVFTSVSIGITFSSIGYQSATDLLRDADLSMYKVKENGRAGYQVFAQNMHDELLNRVRLETELRKALERKEFCLYYQPILALKTGKIVGFEALIRWKHPQYGLVSPGDFIPLAEETGLIVNMGKWVLAQACQQLQTWQQQYISAHSLTMSVNISARQLKEPDLVSTVEEILQDTQIDQRLLKLEITETVLMENEAVSIKILEKLQKQGISLCLDDFGTGYSSLSYLHHFPVNVLKVDQSFVQRIGDQSGKIEIIQGIIALAHSLNMEVIAEGIETRKQFDFLKSSYCEYGQGYFFSRPLDSIAAERLLQDG
ncbi:PAS domain S-box/diguanylate cyclase (GGDEF) domain-containing protein [Gloeocapsa sp. PCC 73106]|nr:PAS domain S-box/diguanylate cyclase (GGDEF) domain-containing protein [Gloeocapsa sp. PCC 73106]